MGMVCRWAASANRPFRSNWQFKQPAQVIRRPASVTPHLLDVTFEGFVLYWSFHHCVQPGKAFGAQHVLVNVVCPVRAKRTWKYYSGFVVAWRFGAHLTDIQCLRFMHLFAYLCLLKPCHLWSNVSLGYGVIDIYWRDTSVTMPNGKTRCGKSPQG